MKGIPILKEISRWLGIAAAKWGFANSSEAW